MPQVWGPQGRIPLTTYRSQKIQDSTLAAKRGFHKTESAQGPAQAKEGPGKDVAKLRRVKHRAYKFHSPASLWMLA